MRIEGRENDAATKIQRLTASEFLPQMPQDEFVLGDRYAETPGNMADQGRLKCSGLPFLAVGVGMFEGKNDSAPFDTAI